MSDEGFHEIQLNGKQLVFLFMAATVMAVVIFLCGVLVGRGVPVRAGSATDATEQASLDPTAAPQEPSGVQAVASTGNAPVTAQETLTYPSLLEDPNPPAETLAPSVEPAKKREPVVAPRPVAAASKPAAAALRPVAPTPPAPAAPRPAAAAPRPAPVASPPSPVAPQPAAVAARPALVTPPPAAAPRAVTAAPATPPADAALTAAAGTGFVVQVAAVRQRAEADTIARRLTTKGYPAFVTIAGANFRVRVGKYTDRREAESIAGRLEKEEKFKPWITR